MKKGMPNVYIILNFMNRIEQENIRELSDCIRKKGIRRSVFSDYENTENLFQYDVKLPQYKVSDQGQTGRCWIYAAFNMIRPSLIQKHRLKDILFSQNYIAFYDLLEKANYFLEMIFETLDEDIDGRFLSMKLQHPIQDAGQWFYFQNIVEKYGLVTQEAMPDNMHSQNTSELISVLSDLLRENACEIRSEYKQCRDLEGFRMKKESMLYEIYRILAMSLGEPPERFDADLELMDGTFVKEKQVTPREFYEKYISENYNEDYCMIVNIPLETKPYHKNYKVSYLGNVWNAKTYPYLNLPMQELKQLVKKQVEAGIPVWFGCDSRVYTDRDNGIFSLELFDLKTIGYQTNMLKKEENLQYGLSNLTHAMVIKGFSCDQQGNIDKWLVENSYGEKMGHQGYFTMSDEWFDVFVYEAVIHKKFLDDTRLSDCEKESIMLPTWDILGTLAN